MQTATLAIVFLPLLGAIIAGFLGRLIGARASEIMTTAFLMIAAALSWMVFITIGMQGGQPYKVHVSALDHVG